VIVVRVKSCHELESNLRQIVDSLRGEGSVVTTKNGQACAVLMPVTEDTDLEIVALSQNRSFWKLYDDALERATSEGWTSLDDL